nr:uncharacterized protein LOC112779492 [Arachis hypogaea]
METCLFVTHRLFPYQISPLRRPGQPSRCVAVCTSAEETAREGETHEGESGFEAELRSSHRVGALFTSPTLLSSPDAIDGGRRREEKRGLAVVAGEPNRCRSGLSERENANRGQAGEPPLLFAIPTVLPITSTVWNCAALPGCRGTPFSSPEEHCCGHLSRVEGERATGGRRTWPSSPLSPETATESSVLGCGFVLVFCAWSCSRLVLLSEAVYAAAKMCGLCFEAAFDFGWRRKGLGEAFGL